jgi:hypothetical protein
MRDDETAGSLVCFLCNMCISLVFCVWVGTRFPGAGVYGLIAAWTGAGGTCMYVWVYRSWACIWVDRWDIEIKNNFVESLQSCKQSVLFLFL